MMRQARFSVLAAVFTLTLAMPLCRAQEPTKPAETGKTEESSEPAMGWQIANFVLLAGFLAYMISKNAGKFFDARNEQIQRSLKDAASAKRDAEQRVTDMERRIASLAGEIDTMRENMGREMSAEAKRIEAETERHVRRIQEEAQQEIENMVKAARRELKTYSAELAIKLAEDQLRGRITRDVENRLVSSFVADLGIKAGGPTNN